ncbi:pathogenesis-related thaumatin-like protein 3.5 [Salvia divinorum]|uniref:Pathogenesis-related thaumatin-like protein 3.5 n=1 Tax=Salvia divinorum TaxID=28513 RepID=A0ABD1HL43_SALDI
MVGIRISQLLLQLFSIGLLRMTSATIFTLQNSCSYTVWPLATPSSSRPRRAGVIQCSGGGVPPVSLAEFTIGSGAAGKDFYDVSLVDGYNVGISVQASGGTGDCQSAGCVSDVNANCPKELQVVDGAGAVVACRSACAAFETPEFCCTGAHATSATCGPTSYSDIFKSACPTAYSYAYDDLSSTCTCTASDYLIMFCPST